MLSNLFGGINHHVGSKRAGLFRSVKAIHVN